jgi:hypothetical protein
MVKYFCDVCEEELSEQEVNYCNEMIGYGYFCHKHMSENNSVSYQKSWDQDRFQDKAKKWVEKITDLMEANKKHKTPKLPGTVVANGKHYAKNGDGWIYPVD